MRRRVVGRVRGLIGSGRFWGLFWLAWVVVWAGAMVPTLTVWSANLRWTNFMSDAALILACAAAAQSSLAMRKADKNDPL